MSYDAGQAYLQIIPSFRGFGAAVRREAAAAGRDAGQVFSEEFNRTVGSRTGGANVGPNRGSSARQGAASAGAFAEAFRARLDAARRSFGDIEIGVATSAAEQQLKDLQVRIAALGSKEIDVDIGATEAMNEVRLLQAQLEILAANSPEVRVRVNAAQAVAELKLLQTQIARLDGKNPVITPVVNPAPALGGIALIAGALLTLLPILIPIAAASTAALAGIATGAFVAAAGIGVLVLALYKVVGAVMAGKAADDAAKQSGATVASQRIAQANAADQLESAERSLANTRATNARQEQQAARAVTDATRRLTDVRRENARATQSAVAAVRDAESRLTDAQRRALDAQQALTRAREDAKRTLEDLDSKVKNNALAQRDAALELQKAEAQLAFVREFGAQANARQIEQAQLAYDQAKQRADDLARDQERLTTDQQAAARAGVEGSDQVLAAKKAINDADAAAKQAEKDLAEARQAAARTQQDNARNLADAQRALADAHARVADQARQSAFALANAQQAVVSAQRAVEQASTRMDVGASAVNKYEEALAKLSPAGRRFVEFIRGSLLPGFDKVRKAAEDGLLPGLQRGLEGAAPAFQPLLRFITATSEAFGGLFESAGKALGGPFWTQFLDFWAEMIGPNAKIFGRIIGNLAKAVAGLLVAFEPLSRAFGEGFAKMTERWAKFAEAAASGKSEKFNKFLAYLRRIIPKVRDFLNELGDALGRIIRSLGHVGEDLMGFFTPILDFIGKIPPSVLGGIVAGLLAIGGAVLGVSLALKAVAAVRFLAANPIFLIIGLAAALIHAYRHSEKFRAIVDATFRAIGKVVSWVWREVLEPAFTWIRDFTMDRLVPAALWLWEHAIRPAFDGIATAVSWAWNNVIKPAFQAWVSFYRDILWPAIRFLWERVIQPIFRAIGTAIGFWWRNIVRPIFGALVTYFRDILWPTIRFLWKNVVQPVFRGIGEIIEFAWERVIRPVFRALRSGVEALAPVFSAAVSAIGTVWDGLRAIASAPVNFVIDTVLNNGIIDAIRTVQGWFGLPKLGHIPNPLKSAPKTTPKTAEGGRAGGRIAFAEGGIMPGYTPGVDNALIAVGGGEAIMRPEWTRAVGAEYVNFANEAARRGGVRGVARALGLPGFALGGVFRGIKKGIGKAVDFGVGAAKFVANPVAWLKDKLAGPLGRLDELGGGVFTDAIKAAPRKLVDGIIDAAKRILGFGSGDDVDKSARGAAALQFALAQRGKPYVWGGVGPAGFDCSGFMGALTNVIAGQNPYQRLFTTASFAGGPVAGWSRGTDGKFVIGVVQGDPGHMAGTLHGVHVESRGGDGVVVGPSARGADDPSFTDRFRLAGYDAGGYLPPGVTMAVNRTGRPEPVLSAAQWDTISAALSGRSGGYSGPLFHADEFHTHENQTPYEIAQDLAWVTRRRWP